jgi:hypothetical protein
MPHLSNVEIPGCPESRQHIFMCRRVARAHRTLCLRTNVAEIICRICYIFRPRLPARLKLCLSNTPFPKGQSQGKEPMPECLSVALAVANIVLGSRCICLE